MKVLALILLGVAGCFAATTIEILSVNPNESELVRLVQLAGLVDALNQDKSSVNILIYLYFLFMKCSFGQSMSFLRVKFVSLHPRIVSLILRRKWR